MKILLDTNVLSELMKTSPSKVVLKWIDSIPAAQLHISAVTKAEIELGLALLPDGKRKTKLSAAAGLMFDEFSGRCLPFDCVASSRYAKLVAERSRIGAPVSVEDAQIAAISLTNGMSLATRKTKDFEAIKGLTVINPWQLR